MSVVTIKGARWQWYRATVKEISLYIIITLSLRARAWQSLRQVTN